MNDETRCTSINGNAHCLHATNNASNDARCDTRVSYFKFELIHAWMKDGGCNVTQREYLKFVSAILVHV